MWQTGFQHRAPTVLALRVRLASQLGPQQHAPVLETYENDFLYNIVMSRSNLEDQGNPDMSTSDEGGENCQFSSSSNDLLLSAKSREKYGSSHHSKSTKELDDSSGGPSGDSSGDSSRHSSGESEDSSDNEQSALGPEIVGERATGLGASSAPSNPRPVPVVSSSSKKLGTGVRKGGNCLGKAHLKSLVRFPIEDKAEKESRTEIETETRDLRPETKTVNKTWNGNGYETETEIETEAETETKQESLQAQRCRGKEEGGY
ncbi:hypothetical protein BDV93DRAFT_513034 [Ceratobasidium sp. AG-I]|nr:hypothetical protein BDV93DRAFT_513034 [Ceratobasidium sp. AG-I]